MKLSRYAGIWICLLLPVSCSTLPDIHPLTPSSPTAATRFPCSRPFLQDRWELVHAVRATLPDGQPQSMLGTVIVTPEENAVHCVLMSIEGLVLLDIESRPAITVNRAVPPFDESAMQNGLIQDVRLLFLKPLTDPVATGLAEDRSLACRYQDTGEQTTDVRIAADGTWRIDQYSSLNRLRRTVQASQIRPVETAKSVQYLPGRLELTAHGIVGYKLVLDLIEAVPL